MVYSLSQPLVAGPCWDPEGIEITYHQIIQDQYQINAFVEPLRQYRLHQAHSHLQIRVSGTMVRHLCLHPHTPQRHFHLQDHSPILPALSQPLASGSPGESRLCLNLVEETR